MRRHSFNSLRILVALLPVLWLTGGLSAHADGFKPLAYLFPGLTQGVSMDAGKIVLDEGSRGLEIKFPVDNVDISDADLSYYVLIRDLQGNRIIDKEGQTRLQPGKHYVVVPLGAVDLGSSASDRIKYVVSYTLRASGGKKFSGRRSLYHLGVHPEVSATIPEEAFKGHPIRIPVRMTDSSSHKPFAGIEVRLSATQANGKEIQASCKTDERGSGLLEFGASQRGSLSVKIKASVPGAVDPMVEGSIEVVEKSRILLSTDKPMYQPGQTLHLRALVLERPEMKAKAGIPAVFEVFDAKGNKVFKEERKTNSFGVASTQFTLATQVNQGAYRVSLTSRDQQTEKTVTVDRYVLPKFNVKINLDKEFYLPGELVKGTLELKYFFGKPVASGKVKMTLHDYQATWVPFRIIEGTANSEGIWSFEARLPERLAGMPIDGGNASMLLDFEVFDTAGQSRQESRSIIIAASPLQVAVIPEGGVVIPGVENRFFLAVANPSGSPVAARCKVVVTQDGTNPSTLNVGVDKTGIAVFSMSPGQAVRVVHVAVNAESEDGKGSKTFGFETRQRDAQVLLRTGRALARVGDELALDVLSSGAVTDAWLDVTRENQTLLLDTLPLDGGRGSYRLRISPDMEGTLVVSAYVLSDRGEFTRDSRVLIVQQASDLTVGLSLDKETYRPGGKASLSLSVEDAEGRGRQAALGIHVVDEAVFALSQARPGLMKLYFALEEELLKPTYQIGPGVGATLGQLLMSDEGGEDAQPHRQVEAEAAIAAQGEVGLKRNAVSSAGRQGDELRAHLDEYGSWLSGKVIEGLLKSLGCQEIAFEAFRKKVDKAVARLKGDAWGKALLVKSTESQTVRIISRGPDGKLDTWDDVVTEVSPYQLCSYPTTTAVVDGVGMGGGGFWKRGMVAEGAMVPMAAPDERPMGRPRAETQAVRKSADKPQEKEETGSDTDAGSSGGEVRVRTWFPETLFVEDCLITDEKGRASIDIPLADSITTWRVSTVASDRTGKLGGNSTGLRVFQDFFVDIDFPVFLTRKDEVSFPVVVYNYLDESQTVEIQVKKEPWFELLAESRATLTLKAGEVASVRVPMRVVSSGWHSVTIHANGSKGFADAVQRTVEVRPEGQEVPFVSSGRFKTNSGKTVDDDVTLEVVIPGDAIEGSAKGMVQILPGLSSHVVQGMDSMLKLPGGCFEQTTSSAWPNVLALRYIRETEQGTPELEMKAMQYVNSGYQRILTFECQDGGFNWWEGDNPGNTILSALAIQMLRDTQKVYKAVDEAAIQRTFKYLEKTQQSDGSWGEERHLHAGNENLGGGTLRGTCYVAWSLNAGGFADTSAARKALGLIEKKLPGEQDLYTLGLCANALATGDGNRALLETVVGRIWAQAVRGEDEVHWETQGMTLVNSYGASANVEVTALMALALIQSGLHTGDVPAVVNWLAASKDANGNWGYNTQATVLALKTFLLAQNLDAGDTSADVTVLLNGRELATRHFDNGNKDVLWQVEFPEGSMKEKNQVSLRYVGFGNLSYQVVGRHNILQPGGGSSGGPLSIDVTYDRREIKVNDTVKVKAKFLKTDARTKGMVLATLGVPPGFDVLTEDLDSMRENGAIQKYELTGRQLLLYLDDLPPNEPVVVEYRLKARYPVKAQTGESEVGFYYNRDVFARKAGTRLVAE